MNKVTKAIVTTLRDADAVLPAFVQYHLHIGFDHLFLFFDDPEYTIPAWVQDHQAITAFARNQSLEDAWLTTSSITTPHISRSIDTEAMSRQVLNAELALRHANYREIRWLLHIDIDELFYPNGADIDSHFSMLESHGIESVCYPNLEGVVEQKFIDNFFNEVTLFKVNPGLPASIEALKSNADFLKAIPQIPKSFFHFYSSFKSLVRVRESTLPRGVHKFSVPENSTRKRYNNGPVILHYPCCGMNHFVQKYKTLGAFGDQWFGNGSNIKIDFQAHLQGRDIVGSDDIERIDAYYLKNYVFSDPDIVAELITRGLCRRITAPAALLAAQTSLSAHG